MILLILFFVYTDKVQYEQQASHTPPQSIYDTHTNTELTTHHAQTFITHSNPDNSNSPHACSSGLLSQYS